MGDFADLVSSYLVGHSAGVSRLAAVAARSAGLSEPEVVMVRRAGLVHDVGRVAIPTRIWNRPGRLEVDEWEQVRLHPYHRSGAQPLSVSRGLVERGLRSSRAP